MHHMGHIASLSIKTNVFFDLPLLFTFSYKYNMIPVLIHFIDETSHVELVLSFEHFSSFNRRPCMRLIMETSHAVLFFSFVSC